MQLALAPDALPIGAWQHASILGTRDFPQLNLQPLPPEARPGSPVGNMPSSFSPCATKLLLIAIAS